MAKIAVRTDGGDGIGLGHVMRCLSLAEAFTKAGHDVCFLGKLNIGLAIAKDRGFRTIKLEQDEFEDIEPGRVLQNELKAMIRFLKASQIDIVIVDSYQVSAIYLTALRQSGSKLVYIDDENKFSIPADVVINGNLTAPFLGYRKYDIAQILLLGAEYNLIRSEFKNLPVKAVTDKVKTVLLTTGGTDSFHVTSKILNTVLKADEFANLRFNVLVGGGFTNIGELVDLSKMHSRVRLFSSQRRHSYPEIEFCSVANLMMDSDIAISAGGSTLYELAACGTPVLAFILADNQRFLVEKMAELGYVRNIGWYDQLEAKELVRQLHALIHHFTARAEMSRKGQNLVDAIGSERIVNHLLQAFAL
jgi:UDP-2,4-diacetamido-2,4,6-trideoxy-beta-L-altropyranose hydrolase